jgi:hypothetical protein
VWIFGSSLYLHAQQGPRLVLSGNGNYVVESSSGQPFFLNGEAAWSLIVNLSKADAELYLENRRLKGYDFLLVNLIDHAFSSNPPANFYGDQPFTSSGNFNNPNEAYFAHADWVIQKAGEKGIVLLLAPLYLGYGCGSEGWCSEVQGSSPNAMRNYGRFLGNRYANYPNIVWAIGGDTDPTPVSDKVQKMISGIEDYDTLHLMTAHNAP